jgi:hypothetical protein
VTAAAVKASLGDIEPLRALFLRESNHQVRYHACHARGWTDSYLLTRDGVRIGYGSVKGGYIECQTNDTLLCPLLFEFAKERGAEVVATGGFLLHYNLPFADMFMEVRGIRAAGATGASCCRRSRGSADSWPGAGRERGSVPD